MKKKSIINSLIFILSLAFSIYAAELVAEKIVTKELEYWSLFEHDSQVGWKTKSNLSETVTWYPKQPHLVTTNKLGFRDSLDPNKIEKNQLKIFVQGDSNVLGFGMLPEQTMTSLLQNDLDNKNQDKFKIINAGVSGYDLQNYILQFDQINKNYRDGKFFLIFNLGNDFWGSLSSVAYLIPRPYYDFDSNGILTKYPSPFRVQTQQYKLSLVPSLSHFQAQLDISLSRKRQLINLGKYVGNSYFLYLAYSRLKERNEKIEKFFGVKPYPIQIGIKQSEFDAARCFTQYAQYDVSQSKFHDLTSAFLEALFREYKNKFLGYSLPTVVLMPASDYIVNPTQFRDGLSSCGIDNINSAVDDYHLRIKTILAKTGLPYIDLLSNFTNKPDLFLENNEHLSAEGHKLISKVLYEATGLEK